VRGGFDYWRWSRSVSIERSVFPRKNLVFVDNIEGDQLVVVDPDTGDEIWASPPLRGTVSRDGVHFVDVAGNGALRISVATSLGMYLTR
jgi:outer membrane protein assembly factor BamB